ncbi:MAG: PIN domain-containing protein [Acidobacteriota bacterium]
MQPVLLDTSVYVAALRQEDHVRLALRSLARGALVWLSAVVLEELYAGTRPKDQTVIQRLDRDFRSVNRLLAPNLNDWVQTGRVLSQLAQKYGSEQIGRGRLTNDALIAISAVRTGAVLFTANKRDFARLAEFRSFTWRVLPPEG